MTEKFNLNNSELEKFVCSETEDSEILEYLLNDSFNLKVDDYLKAYQGKLLLLFNQGDVVILSKEHCLDVSEFFKKLADSFITEEETKKKPKKVKLTRHRICIKPVRR